MASLKYFFLCPFVFLCISCTFANRVLNSDLGGPNLPLDKPLPVTEDPKGAMGGGLSGGRRGVDPIINGFGVGVGVGVGYRPGYGGPGGYWSGPGFEGPNSECMLGYVCPSSDRRGCNGFSYEGCRSYGFYPLTSIDHHEVEINWATSKTVETAQFGNSGPHQSSAQHGNFGPHQAHFGNPGPHQTPPITVDDDQPTKPPSGV